MYTTVSLIIYPLKTSRYFPTVDWILFKKKKKHSRTSICVNISLYFLSLGKIAGSCGKPIFSFKRNHQTVFHWQSHKQCISNPISPDPYQHFLLFLFFFNFSYFDNCIMISHCSFNFHFLITTMLNIFSGACLPCISLWKVSYLILSFESSLYIPDTRSLLEMWFTSSFS